MSQTSYFGEYILRKLHNLKNNDCSKLFIALILIVTRNKLNSQQLKTLCYRLSLEGNIIWTILMCKKMYMN